MSPRFNQPATTSLADALAKNPNNLGTAWKGRIESRKYRREPGNFTEYGSAWIARRFGVDALQVYRIEYGFGKANVVVTLRDGSQRSLPVEALGAVLQPNGRGGHEISPSQEIKEYY